MNKSKVYLNGVGAPTLAAPIGAEYEETGISPVGYWVNTDGTQFGWVRGNNTRPYIPLEQLLHGVPNQQVGWVMPWGKQTGLLEGGGLYTGTSGTTGTTSARIDDGLNGPCIRYRSTGSDIGFGFATTRLIHRLAYELRFTAYFRVIDTTEPRFFIGISSTTRSNMAGSNDPAASYVGIQYSQARDANFQLVADDGTTQTLFDTAIAIDTNIHGVRLIANSDGTLTADFLDGSEAVQATNEFTAGELPAATTGMAQGFALEQTGAGAQADVHFYCMYGINTFGNVEA